MTSNEVSKPRGILTPSCDAFGRWSYPGRRESWRSPNGPAPPDGLAPPDCRKLVLCNAFDLAYDRVMAMLQPSSDAGDRLVVGGLVPVIFLAPPAPETQGPLQRHGVHLDPATNVVQVRDLEQY
jgi:hypothetical protein